MWFGELVVVQRVMDLMSSNVHWKVRVWFDFLYRCGMSKHIDCTGLV